MIRLTRVPALGLGLALVMGGALCIDPSVAQEGKGKAANRLTKSKKAEGEEEKGKASEARSKKAAASEAASGLSSDELAQIEASARRVPRNFGQIGLSDDQRAKITEIQSKRLPKIHQLRKEMEAAQKEMMGECEAVLTADQKKQLAGLRSGDAPKKEANGEAKKK